MINYCRGYAERRLDGKGRLTLPEFMEESKYFLTADFRNKIVSAYPGEHYAAEDKKLASLPRGDPRRLEHFAAVEAEVTTEKKGTRRITIPFEFRQRFGWGGNPCLEVNGNADHYLIRKVK